MTMERWRIERELEQLAEDIRGDLATDIDPRDVAEGAADRIETLHAQVSEADEITEPKTEPGAGLFDRLGLYGLAVIFLVAFVAAAALDAPWWAYIPVAAAGALLATVAVVDHFDRRPALVEVDDDQEREADKITEPDTGLFSGLTLLAVGLALVLATVGVLTFDVPSLILLPLGAAAVGLLGGILLERHSRRV